MDISNGREVEVPVVEKVVLPMLRVPLVRSMVVSASTVRASANSSKSNELEVTCLPVKLRVLPDQVRSVPAVITVLGSWKKEFQSEVEAVNGIL